MPRRSASSCTVGERPCCWESSAVAVVSDRRSSWRRRGTRTAQPLSRKCRLISPTTVGVAYVELDSAVRVEPVHGLDQSDRRDLGQVVQRLAPVAESAGQVLDEREVHAHQPVAQLRLLRRAVGKLAQLDEECPRPAAVMWIVVPVLAHLARPLCLRLLHRDRAALGPVRTVHRVRPGLLLRDGCWAHHPGADRLVPHRTVPVPVAHAGPGPAPRCL